MRKFITFITALAFAATGIADAAPRRPIVMGATGTMQQIQSGDTVATRPSVAGGASINIPHGVAPTSPNNGDCWTTTGSYYCRINGVTLDLSDAQGNRIVPGCVGDGVADDTTCLQNAINAHQNGTLFLGKGLYKISSALSSAGPITIIGQGGGQGLYATSCNYGIRTSNATQDAIDFNATSRLIYTCIDTSVTKTGGVAVYVAAANNSILFGNTIYRHFFGFDISGSGATQNIGTFVQDNVIVPVDASGAVAIRIGPYSTGASTVGIQIISNQIYCYVGTGSHAIGMLFKDSGGAFVRSNDIFGCNYGTYLNPSANQQIIWSFFDSTVLGDTSETNDMVIDGGNATTQIKGNHFSQAWASSAKSNNVVILDSGGSGNVKGNQFVGTRIYPTSTNIGLYVGAGSGLLFNDSHVCASPGATGKGIVLTSGASDSIISNNAIGSCDHVGGGTFSYGIDITQTNSVVGIIRSNDFIGSTTTINFAPSSGNSSTAMIDGNLGIDNLTTTLASAATITLTPVKNYLLTGTTAVTTINGAWSARVVTLTPTNAAGLTFNTGGNLCNAVTATQNQVVTAYYDGGSTCWRLR